MKIRDFKIFFGKNLFKILFLVSFLLFSFFRLYRYQQRIFVEADNTRDAQVGIYAANYLKIPRIGIFTSGGPFFYGPFWYWFLAILSFLPLGNLTLWYVFTFISSLYFFTLFFIGKNLGSKWLGLIMTFFYSVSPMAIIVSLGVWNPDAIPILALVQISLYLLYYERKAAIFLYLLFFSVGSAITIHLQGILMLPILFISLITHKVSFKRILFSFLCFLAAFTPLIIFDLKFNFFNSRNFYRYITVDQYNIWVPNRWLFYLRDYWPQTWGEIIGGNYVFGLLTIVITTLSLLFVKRGEKKKIYLLASIFLLEIIIFRYYRGERFYYYSYFSLPYVITLSSWAIYKITARAKTVGVLLIILFLSGSAKKSIDNFYNDNLKYTDVVQVKNEIYSQYPNNSFEIFGCNSAKGTVISHPLSYFTFLDGRTSEEDLKIGVCMSRKLKKPIWQILTTEELEKQPKNWNSKSTRKVYEDVVEWWKKDPPK